MRNFTRILVTVLLISLAFPLVFSSCKDDESKGASLVGTWEETSYVSSGCVDPTDNESFTCTSACERIVVTENTLTIGTDPAISYTVNGNQITLTQKFGSATVTFSVTFTVTETTLTITQQDEAADGGCKNVSVYKRV